MLKIIQLLWSSVYDLLFIIRGQGKKTMEEVERDLVAIEMLCRPYTDAEDPECFVGKGGDRDG